MKKMAFVAVMVLALAAGAWAAFVAPTADQIGAAAKDARKAHPLTLLRKAYGI